MRGANGRNLPANRRAAASKPGSEAALGSPAYTAEVQEKVRCGLRIMARIIARSYLRQREPGSGPETRPPAEGEDRD